MKTPSPRRHRTKSREARYIAVAGPRGAGISTLLNLFCDAATTPTRVCTVAEADESHASHNPWPNVLVGFFEVRDATELRTLVSNGFVHAVLLVDSGTRTVTDDTWTTRRQALEACARTHSLEVHGARLDEGVSMHTYLALARVSGITR